MSSVRSPCFPWFERGWDARGRGQERGKEPRGARRKSQPSTPSTLDGFEVRLTGKGGSKTGEGARITVFWEGTCDLCRQHHVFAEQKTAPSMMNC